MSNCEAIKCSNQNRLPAVAELRVKGLTNWIKVCIICRQEIRALSDASLEIAGRTSVEIRELTNG